MKVKVQIDSANRVIKNLGLDESGDVQRTFTGEVLRRIQKYMPKRSGETIRLMVAQTNINKPEIIVDEPQATMLYYGISKSGKPINYTTTKNRLAGPNWDGRMVAAEGEVITQTLQDYIKKKGGKR